MCELTKKAMDAALREQWDAAVTSHVRGGPFMPWAGPTPTPMPAEILEFKMVGRRLAPAGCVAIAVRMLAAGPTVLIDGRPIQLTRGELGVTV